MQDTRRLDAALPVAGITSSTFTASVSTVCRPSPSRVYIPAAVAAALPVDVIPLLSPSAARALVALGLDLGAARVVVIGPTTAAACEALGLTVAAVAKEASAAGLAEVAARVAQARSRP